MTSQEFTLWLKGFIDGVHKDTVTSKQWSILKEKLAEVEDRSQLPFGVPNTSPTLVPPYTNPYDPYRVTCADGTHTGAQIHTKTGYITNDNAVTFTVTTGSNELNYIATDFTRAMLSGSWHYTATNDKTLLND